MGQSLSEKKNNGPMCIVFHVNSTPPGRILRVDHEKSHPEVQISNGPVDDSQEYKIQLCQIRSALFQTSKLTIPCSGRFDGTFNISKLNMTRGCKQVARRRTFVSHFHLCQLEARTRSLHYYGGASFPRGYLLSASDQSYKLNPVGCKCPE